jgi:hypothetical protein
MSGREQASWGVCEARRDAFRAIQVHLTEAPD